MAYAYTSKRVVTPEGVREAALVVEDGKIVQVCAPEELAAGTEVMDFGQDVLLPGLVDTHVHINEPGRTEWEGYATATRAAAAGGFTTLVDMPLNCLPETTTVEALEIKRSAAAGQCVVDWAAWGGAVADNQEHLEGLAAAGVPGYKCFLIYPGCEGFTMIDLQQLEDALPHIAKTGLPLLVHAELAGPIDAVADSLKGKDWRKYSTYLASRPDEAELVAIEEMIRLCRKYRFKLHIVHLATAQALPMLRAAKAEGLPVTSECCPHHLHFAAEQIPDGATQFKCTPPIRSAANRDALWAGLREGVIDMIATDHSPCPAEMKRFGEGFDVAWGGIPSLSTALPVVWTECVRRGCSLEELANWMSSGPAALAGLSARVGALAVGHDANFVVFDDAATFVVSEDRLHYKHKISPYMGETLTGVVKATYLRGEIVFDGAAFAETARGREYR
jgi:allantoinase